MLSSAINIGMFQLKNISFYNYKQYTTLLILWFYFLFSKHYYLGSKAVATSLVVSSGLYYSYNNRNLNISYNKKKQSNNQSYISKFPSHSTMSYFIPITKNP